MKVAILILTIFNTGLALLIIGGIVHYEIELKRFISAAVQHADESIEAATTAVFNMDSIKQNVDTSGRFEL